MFTRGFFISIAIEFGPVLIFFAIARTYGILAGTASLVITTIGALIWSLKRDNRIPLFSVISSTFVLVCGGATLISRDPYWVVLEYTVYNGSFGAVLLFGYIYGHGLLKQLFGTMFHISDRGWKILSLRWSFFFLAVAFGNEYVWRAYGEDPWVHYRLLAAAFLCLFGFSQFFLARRHRLPDASRWGLRI
jgi:intracellular septation protein